MKHLLIPLLVAIALLGLAACQDTDETITGGSSPSQLARTMVIGDAEFNGHPIDLESITADETENDGSYATVRVTALRRPDASSPWLKQYVDIRLVNPTDQGWSPESSLVSWRNTEEQEALFQATEEAAAQATQVEKERDRQDALRLIEVEILQEDGLEYHSSLGAPLPVLVHNRHDKSHEVTFRLKFRFPDGEVYSFSEPSIVATSKFSQRFEVRGVISTGTPSKYKYSRPLISLVEWQIVVGGIAGEIHRIER